MRRGRFAARGLPKPKGGNDVTRFKFAAMLLAGTAFCLSAPAFAQDPQTPQDTPDPAEPDASDTAADAAIANAQPVDDTQAKIVLLQEQVEALQASIDALKKQTAPDGKPSFASSKASWAEKTKIGGKVFLNVSSISQKSDGLDSSQNGTQAELKRFYISVDHQLNDMFSANLTTDFRYNANGTSKDVLVYVKKAYLQAKFAPQLFVRVGVADLPWVPFVEDLYGFRYVENVLIDRTKYGTSSDWGVHLGGTFGDGLVSYALSAINGAGYKTLSRSSNTIDLEGRISVKPIKSIVLGIGGYTGKLGKSADNLPSTATPHRAKRLNAVAAYVAGPVRVGVEYFAAKNWNNVATATSDKTNGWSAFASYAFTPKVSVFGRYDWVNPNKLTNGPMREHYFNVGVGYQPVTNIDLALVYKRDKASNGILSTSNGNIGGVDQGTYNEVGVFGQVKF